MAAPYIGNNDFRGYLNYLSQNGDVNAGYALNYTGNDGGIDSNAFESFYDSPTANRNTDRTAGSNYVRDAYNTWSGYGVVGAQQGTGGSQADDLAYLADQEGILRQLLAEAGTTRQQGYQSIEDSYNKQLARGNEDQSRALSGYATQRDDTFRDREKALGQVNNNASSLAQSLRRMIGMASGAGSSAYKYAAPNAVARVASQGRAQQFDTSGENLRNIDTAESDTKSSFERMLADLAEQRNAKKRDFESGILGQENSLSQQLADLAGERARVQGGGYSAVRGAQAPYLADINSRRSAMSNLFNQYRDPQYTPQAVNVASADLTPYTVDRQAINANRGQGQSQYSPYLQFLRSKKDEQYV